MSKNIIKGLVFTFLGLTLIACSRRSGQTADNSAPGVQISNNQSSTTESKGEKVENTTKSPDTTDSSKVETTTVEPKTIVEQKSGNTLAKQAIAEIEKRKKIILDENYDILIQAQTSDTIDLQIRHEERSSTSIYGFFRYHAKDHKLEEMDSLTGEYKVVE